MNRTARAYLLEAKYEFVKLARMPAFSIPAIGFPVLFYWFFGIGFGGGKSAGPVTMATYLLATYGAFGVIGAALFGFGVSVAIERGQGWMLLKRATPMPPLAYFTAKLAMSVLFGAIIVALLGVLGTTLGGVQLSLKSWLALFGILVAGALPFGALGLAFGYICGPNSAPPVVNLVYLPMAFASGLWIPIEALPKLVQGLAQFLPAYHYAQLALGTIGAGRGESAVLHLAVLLGFTVVGLAIALAGYRRDEGKAYG